MFGIQMAGIKLPNPVLTPQAQIELYNHSSFL